MFKSQHRETRGGEDSRALGVPEPELWFWLLPWLELKFTVYTKGLCEICFV